MIFWGASAGTGAKTVGYRSYDLKSTPLVHGPERRPETVYVRKL